MEAYLAAILIGIPLMWLLAMAAYAYVDAPRHGMNPKKWAAISFFVPLFGFFTYIFEREDRTTDPDDRELLTESGFEIHESRAGEGPLEPKDSTSDDEDAKPREK